MSLHWLLFLKSHSLQKFSILGILLVVILSISVFLRFLLTELKDACLINENQSAFLTGRRIMDIILLAQEVIKDYGIKGGKPRCTIKQDSKKVFDSVSWIVLTILYHMGFPPLYISWIK